MISIAVKLGKSLFEEKEDVVPCRELPSKAEMLNC